MAGLSRYQEGQRWAFTPPVPPFEGALVMSDANGSPPQIHFRHLGSDVSADCEPGWNWQVEYHVGRGFPVGLAWVIAPPPSDNAGPSDGRSRPVIKFVLVSDDARRQGIASALVEACRGRWPEVELTLSISEAGLGLRRRVEPPATAAGSFDPAFVSRFLTGGGTMDELDRLAREMEEHAGAAVTTMATGPGDPGEAAPGRRPHPPERPRRAKKRGAG